MEPTARTNFDLERFVAAQDAGATYDEAREELRRGHKRSHWMWFVFPQIAGLGLSSTSQRYAISGLDEARAYLSHPVLGPRLHECVGLLLSLPETALAEEVLGSVDAVKLRSSVTLFLRADPAAEDFARLLDRYFEGMEDPATIARL